MTPSRPPRPLAATFLACALASSCTTEATPPATTPSGPPATAPHEDWAPAGEPGPTDPQPRTVPLSKLVERTMAMPELAGFWHEDLPDRVPVRVAPASLLGDVDPWTMFGKPIELVENAPDGAPVFRLVRINATEARVVIEFSYAIEGVGGHATFEARGDDWELVDRQVAER